ncbi:hypothetical protein [Mesorhizobium temperatum]|uniref:hypothetical protein n=1 Tax=Mesorhizobium temperatum TaxID=241416 RepID=UPI00117C2EF2|nr:hypothetical protein [Mesorhizobium temperatum]
MIKVTGTTIMPTNVGADVADDDDDADHGVREAAYSTCDHADHRVDHDWHSEPEKRNTSTTRHMLRTAVDRVGISIRL